ncbi:MAG: hypothetical protein RIQ81_1493 [Pseudomonadota bacterium]|jgi:aspartate racemase
MPALSVNQTGTRSLGIIGGLSWVSTLLYYRWINEAVQHARGRQASAELVIRSVDFQPVIDAQMANDWARAGQIVVRAAADIARAGASAFLIASNTMHLAAAAADEAVNLPRLDIFDATAAAIQVSGCSQVALLGTRYTMDMPFFRDQFRQRGIDVIVPEAADGRRVNEIIFRELIHDRMSADASRALDDIVGRMQSRGAGGVILGCTELALYQTARIGQRGDLLFFDSARLHALAAAEWLLQDPNKSQ